jgi:hypothetical protein
MVGVEFFAPGDPSALADLKYVVLLAAPARRLGPAGHVELLLLFSNVGEDRAQAVVLDNRSLVDLRTLIESAVLQIDAVVPDRQPPVGIVDHGDPACAPATARSRWARA